MVVVAPRRKKSAGVDRTPSFGDALIGMGAPGKFASYPKGRSARRQIGLEGWNAPKVNEISPSVPSIAGKA